jgi:hypothetical protein
MANIDLQDSVKEAVKTYLKYLSSNLGGEVTGGD